MIIDIAEYTCPGGHEINEDSYLCNKDKGIFIVADGLGGHSEGEIASSAAIRYFKDNCLGGYNNERISELMEGANKEVLKNGSGGKTTVAAAFIENGRFIYANAGDSRVYFFRNNRIIAQTKDHSVCQASVDMGLITPDDIRGSEDRSRLLKVLGNDENLNIKKYYQPIKLENGDSFLICSDGFWDYVYESEMEADLLKSNSADAWLKYMLKRHIIRGQNKGDNYTALCGIVHLDENDVFEDISDGPENEIPVKEEIFFTKQKYLIGLAAIVMVVIIALCISLPGKKKSDEGSPDDETETTITTMTENQESEPPADDNTVTESQESEPPADDNTVTENQESEPPADDNTVTENQESELPADDNTVTENQESEPPVDDNTVTEGQESEPPFETTVTDNSENTPTPLFPVANFETSNV